MEVCPEWRTCLFLCPWHRCRCEQFFSISGAGAHQRRVRPALGAVMFQTIAVFLAMPTQSLDSPPPPPPAPVPHPVAWSEGTSNNIEKTAFCWIIHCISPPGANWTSVQSLKWFCGRVFESCTLCEMLFFHFFVIATTKDPATVGIRNRKSNTGYLVPLVFSAALSCSLTKHQPPERFAFRVTNPHTQSVNGRITL